jgi:hypothetical protein
MEIRLYVDEDAMARALLQCLRARGVDVLTVLEAGLVGADDKQQLEYSVSSGRTLYTFNVADFCHLHKEFIAAGRTHAGIIVLNRQRYSVGEQQRRLLRLVDSTTAEAIVNSLTFL